MLLPNKKKEQQSFLVKFLQKYCLKKYTQTGFMVGWCNTSVFELIAEVSYPNSSIFVNMSSVIGIGIFRLLYPLFGRFMIDRYGGMKSELFPCIIIGICLVISTMTSRRYGRALANQSEEELLLVDKNSENQ